MTGKFHANFSLLFVAIAPFARGYPATACAKQFALQKIAFDPRPVRQSQNAGAVPLTTLKRTLVSLAPRRNEDPLAIGHAIR